MYMYIYVTKLLFVMVIVFLRQCFLNAEHSFGSCGDPDCCCLISLLETI